MQNISYEEASIDFYLSNDKLFCDGECNCDLHKAFKTFSDSDHTKDIFEELRQFSEKLVDDDERLKNFKTTGYKIITDLDLSWRLKVNECKKGYFYPKLVNYFTLGEYNLTVDGHDLYMDESGTVDVAVLENFGTTITEMYNIFEYKIFTKNNEWMSSDVIPDNIKIQLKEITKNFPGQTFCADDFYINDGKVYLTPWVY